MRRRYLKSCYILAAAALAWMAGIVLLNLTYVRPSFARQARRIEREIAGGWLRLSNYFIQDRSNQMLRCTAAMAEQAAAKGPLGAGGAGPVPHMPFAECLKHYHVHLAVSCDARYRVISAWRVGADGQPAKEERLPEGADLRQSLLFPYHRDAEQVSGVGETPEGLVLFTKCAVRRSGKPDPVGYLLALRPLDSLFFTELSAMVGASVSLKKAFELPPEAAAESLAPAVWREDDHSLIGVQPLRFPTGDIAGHLVVKGQLEPTHWQMRTLSNALTTMLLWAACFALLMIVVIHVVISGPTAKLLRGVQRLRAGEAGVDLSAGLRGEALALAKQFEEVLAHIEKISHTDSLTGVRNRRSFQQAFVREFHHARRYARPMSLAVMDVDYLKAANDVLGHQMGDVILKVFARAIKESVRVSDTVARLGGDEFAILMPETSVAEAATVAERIRVCVASRSIGRGEMKLSPTISVGVSDLTTPGTSTPDALYNLTDKAMYAAKRAGRNRIVQAQQLDEVSALESANDNTKVDDLCKQLAGLDVKFKRLFVDAIGGLISALEARDRHTANHSTMVRRYSLMIARQMNLPERVVDHIGRAAMLHDIGKIGLPDDVLLKESPLSQREWELVKRHPVISVRIMRGMEFLDQEIPAVRHHHERHDGCGYPDRLAGSAIPMEARILSVADAFAAMISSRVFRSSMSVERALGEVRRASGTQFDPAVVEVFLKAMEKEGPSKRTVAAAGRSSPS